ncbi:hypothetical protein, partial [Escherichia coli]|uniref:hypothetical protein n=1 Tax=Escherichia coli TaxID=562 RepID=UPI003984FDBA
MDVRFYFGESVKEKKTAALFVVTFIFIGYASRNTRRDKTETHKASQWLARLYMFVFSAAKVVKGVI